MDVISSNTRTMLENEKHYGINTVELHTIIFATTVGSSTENKRKQQNLPPLHHFPRTSQTCSKNTGAVCISPIPLTATPPHPPVVPYATALLLVRTAAHLYLATSLGRPVVSALYGGEALDPNIVAGDLQGQPEPPRHIQPHLKHHRRKAQIKRSRRRAGRSQVTQRERDVSRYEHGENTIG